MKTIFRQSLIASVFMTLILNSCENTINIEGNAVSQSLPEELQWSDQDKSDIIVSVDKAVTVANNFISKSAIMKDKGKNDNYRIETIYDEMNPVMYIINYSNGGFVIVGSTYNYYPILAYSDENSFVNSKGMGGVSIWINEVKESIKQSNKSSDSIKSVMKGLWNSFDSCYHKSGAKAEQTRSAVNPAVQACYNRLDQYAMNYGDGWVFLPLSAAQSYFDEIGYSLEYQNLCYSADYNHSPREASVIGLKWDWEETIQDPYLQTNWHQNAPFNNYSPSPFSAGCSTIAVAQLMYHYKYPVVDDFSWNNIPIYVVSNSDQDKLARYVQEKIDVEYTHLSFPWYDDYLSWTTPDDLEDGLEEMGYNVYRRNHAPDNVEREILGAHRPVIMLGSDTNLSFLPEPWNYLGTSHYWVCDGCHRLIPNKLLYFTEWQPYGNGQFIQGRGSINNPEECVGQVNLTFHMNWGWGNSYNGWFINANPGNYNFEHSRVDFFISRY